MAYLLDQAIELTGPKTLSGKALLKSKQALQRGDDQTAGKYLYQAFDNLPKKYTDVSLTSKEKQLIEDQLAKLFQKNVTINCKVVDKLANKSYVHLQNGGSIVSYRYLLEALDSARLPIPKSLQKIAPVGSPKLKSSRLLSSNSKSSSNLRSRCGQVGGSAPLIVGFVTSGLAILSLIIYLIRRNRPASELEASTEDMPKKIGFATFQGKLGEQGLSPKEYAERNAAQLAELDKLAGLASPSSQYAIATPTNDPTYGELPKNIREGPVRPMGRYRYEGFGEKPDLFNFPSPPAITRGYEQSPSVPITWQQAKPYGKILGIYDQPIESSKPAY